MTIYSPIFVGSLVEELRRARATIDAERETWIFSNCHTDENGLEHRDILDPSCEPLVHNLTAQLDKIDAVLRMAEASSHVYSTDARPAGCSAPPAGLNLREQLARTYSALNKALARAARAERIVHAIIAEDRPEPDVRHVFALAAEAVR
jgi:L-asparaginase II